METHAVCPVKTVDVEKENPRKKQAHAQGRGHRKNEFRAVSGSSMGRVHVLVMRKRLPEETPAPCGCLRMLACARGFPSYAALLAFAVARVGARDSFDAFLSFFFLLLTIGDRSGFRCR